MKVKLAADIMTEFQEDNIEGVSASERSARELAQQFGNDLADLMLNGDTAATGTDASFLTIGDGIIKQAKTSAKTSQSTRCTCVLIREKSCGNSSDVSLNRL